MYARATSKWYSVSPCLFATARTSLMDADDRQEKDEWA